MQVKPDHVGSLGLEVGIVGSQVAFEPMRLDAVLGPDPRHRHVRNAAAEFSGELARGPVRGAVGWLARGGPRQHPRLDLISHLVALAAGVAREQARQSIRLETLAPAVDVAVAAIELDADLGPGQTIGQQKNQSRMPRRIRAPIARVGLPRGHQRARLGAERLGDTQAIGQTQQGFADRREPVVLYLGRSGSATAMSRYCGSNGLRNRTARSTTARAVRQPRSCSNRPASIGD